MLFASGVPTLGSTLLDHNMAKTIQQLLVVETVSVAGSSTSKDVDSIEIIPRSPQELYEITCLGESILT